MTAKRPVRLSICLPTHHGRARELDAVLGDLFLQAEAVGNGRVQVCVSDNGSGDETARMVERHRSSGRPLVYHRFEDNRGFHANLLRVAELAEGEFCWFLSSDDGIAPGALQHLLERLDDFPDIAGMTLRPNAYDEALSTRLGPWRPGNHPRRPDEHRLFTTFEDAAGACGLLSGLLSSLVVRRSLWAHAVQRLGPAELNRWPYHPHSRIVLAILESQACWLWEPEETVRVRVSEHNSLLADLNGDVPTYHLRTTDEVERMFAETLGRGSAPYRQNLRRMLWSGWNPDLLSGWKRSPLPAAVDRELLVRPPGWFWRFPEFWIAVFPHLLMPPASGPARLISTAWTATTRARRALYARMAT